jgi:glycosyltransferase involved in cell wall biosynthesis
MNIGFLISSTGWGGLEMNTLKLAQEFKINGFNLSLITTKKSTILKNSREEFKNTIIIEKKRKYFDLGCAKDLANKLKSYKIDYLLVFDNKDLDLITWTKKIYFKSLHIIYQQHMQIGINKKDFLHTLRYNNLDKWITPLEYLKDELVLRTKIKENKIEKIQIGLDIQSYNTEINRVECRNQLLLNENEFVIGIIGRISPKKGQFLIIKLLHERLINSSNLKLLIMGSATINDPECQQYEKDIIHYIESNKLEEKIILVPHNENVSIFYKAIDLFVLASEKETYGMVTLEALLFNKIILASNSGGTNEILKNGELGFLFDINNPTNFNEILNQIITNKDEAEEKAKLGYNEIMENYSKKSEFERIKNLICNL